MNAEHRPQTCRWAEPTLYQAWPMWLDAWSWPWSCRSQTGVRLLPVTTECQDCPRWERRDPADPIPAAFGALRGRRCAIG
jgi:hypothetical protein